jgi:S-adenosylmethionine:tRNA ribosyltransferase-isomerase
MSVSDFDYDLPPELIAQHPAERRDASRLLEVPPEGPFVHRSFQELPDLLAPGDVLVVNQSRVFPARLLGRKPTGARAEVLLVRPAVHERGGGVARGGEGGGGMGGEGSLWEALVRPGGKLKPGRTVVVAEGFEVDIVEALPSGNRLVRLRTEEPLEDALDRHGRLPLPPYIERTDDADDRDRYQTVYAVDRGSIAAPTAGLHFTEELLRRIEDRGVRRVPVTLHVGVGTFRPVEVDDPAEHPMHAEWYSISDDSAVEINLAREAGGRVWAVGTTSVRTLESAADPGGAVRPGQGETDLFIRPPYDFRVVDGLITNFHLPRSTLLMLVSALAGRDRILEAYAEAVRERYRFYSYGDAMVITPSAAASLRP